ncbi:Hypothetical predicted protein [Mytilus galloprovincialis]|uniref:Uncharacterized protein n=1 Tax=Mytilus galloprovincialis TaxID=29158 RepID=A0A8B6HC40_MYTGA|nr:Hypothetical predicted protein [Mytilus galloprovincialis]
MLALIESYKDLHYTYLNKSHANSKDDTRIFCPSVFRRSEEEAIPKGKRNTKTERNT